MTMSKSKRPAPQQPATVIRKHGPSKQFAGPSTFRDTGGFSGNGFKAADQAAPR